jgi:hypothetical protein
MARTLDRWPGQLDSRLRSAGGAGLRQLPLVNARDFKNGIHEATAGNLTIVKFLTIHLF